jgi:hypothetical protein
MEAAAEKQVLSKLKERVEILQSKNLTLTKHKNYFCVCHVCNLYKHHSS